MNTFYLQKSFMYPCVFPISITRLHQARRYHLYRFYLHRIPHKNVSNLHALLYLWAEKLLHHFQYILKNNPLYGCPECFYNQFRNFFSIFIFKFSFYRFICIPKSEGYSNRIIRKEPKLILKSLKISTLQITNTWPIVSHIFLRAKTFFETNYSVILACLIKYYFPLIISSAISETVFVSVSIFTLLMFS